MIPSIAVLNDLPQFLWICHNHPPEFFPIDNSNLTGV